MQPEEVLRHGFICATGEEESETGSECDWWPGIGENGRSQHGHGVNTSGSATITPLSQITRKRKIGLYATDSDDTDLDDSSSEKGNINFYLI